MTATRSRSGRGAPSVQELLDAIEAQNEACFEPVSGIEGCVTNEGAYRSCDPPATRDAAEACIEFRRPLTLAPLPFRPPSKKELTHGRMLLKFAQCVPVDMAHVHAALALDLIFDQCWHFQDLIIDRLAATLALAPGEVVRMSVRTSQRKVLSRSTVDEVEQAESTEATIVDRDVINITRSSSQTNNWEVSTNSSVSIPVYGAIVNFGASGGLSGSATRTANATSEQVNEATNKSASNLRALHRIEVSESREAFEEQDRSRRVVNPYRDRSLLVKIYAVAKQYCVDFTLKATQPVLVLDIGEMDFDRDFVLGNAAFLDAYLIDRRLALELPEALEAVVEASDISSAAELEELAGLALRYLFDEPDVFSVPAIGSQDANAPDSSFDAGLSKSGLGDAVANELGMVFTTLNWFFRLYRNEAGNDPQLATRIALAMDASLHDRWFGIEETDAVSNVLDTSDRTEAFRRLGGFLAFVSGTIRPLVRPAEDEKSRVAASRRADFVISRTVAHLRCHQDYYIARYLENLSAITRGVSLVDFVQKTLDRLPQMPGTAEAIGALFAVEQAFVDRNTIVIPGRCVYSPDASRAFAARIDGDDASDLPFGILRAQEVLMPTEGAHLEPVAGRCVLGDVPDPADTDRIDIGTTESPVEVRVLDRPS